MKKAFSVLILFFIFTGASAPVPQSGTTVLGTPGGPQITREGRSDLKPLQRSAFVFRRGIINASTSLLEIGRTLKLEKQTHPKAWPGTYPFRLFYNFFMRISSAGYDIALFPIFVVPFTDDIRPMTRYFDMPDYAYQLEVEEE